MTFTHLIEPQESGCRFIHRVTISGPMSWLFARLIGKNVSASLPSAMWTLARLAETTPAPVG